MAAKKAFKIKSQEQGRGPVSTDSFATLAEAQAFVRSHWQGVEYKDGNASFHTDYSTFECVGFTLADIGKARWSDDWFEWDWLDLDAKEEEANPLAQQLYSAFERYDAKQMEESEPPPF
jgi:hypothetical protein